MTGDTVTLDEIQAAERRRRRTGVPGRQRPGGQSGHPLSRHYADQYPAWLAGELLPITTRPEAVEGDQLKLVPAR